MEIKTCEQYVLAELEKAQNTIEDLNAQVAELQRVIFGVQGYLELYLEKNGRMRIEVDEVAQSDEGVKNFFVQLLGRGKYAEPDLDTDVDSDADIDTEGDVAADEEKKA